MIGHLLLQRLGDGASESDVLPCRVGRAVLCGQVTCDAHQATQFSETQRELATSARPPLCFSEDRCDRTAMEVRDLANRSRITPNLLCDETNQAASVASCIRHLTVDVHFVSIPTDPGSKGGVHPLDGIEVAGGDEHEVTRHRFGLGQSAAGSLGPTADREGSLLHGSEEGLLLVEAKEIDLIDVQHAAVGEMDGTGLHPVMGGRLHAAGLEGIVPTSPRRLPASVPVASTNGGISLGSLDQHLRDAGFVGGSES